MTYHSARRMLSACIAAVALVAALAMATAGTASATSDLTSQCSGASIKGQGSTFQAPAQEPVWNVDFNAVTDTSTTLTVTKADGQKCERCWHYRADVGENAEHPTLCGRCFSNLYGSGESRSAA